MQCPECKLEAYIMGKSTEVLGDESPETETEVWSVLEFECRNPACQMNGKKVGEVRHRVYPPP